MNDENESLFEPPVTVKVGQIQFIEACHPPLVAGGYKVKMSQLVKKSEDSTIPWNSNPYVANLNFSVDAPRFTLDPTAIHSVYPPANQTGSFDNALPHVVLTRRTLPWERTLDGKPQTLGKPASPWMALLLLEEDELIVSGQNAGEKIKRYESRALPIFSEVEDSLLNPFPEEENKTIWVPDLGQLRLAEGEKDPAKIMRADKWKREKFLYEDADEQNGEDKKKSSCLAIDLPAQLFKNIAPRSEDLSFLAHVRQIDTGNKEVYNVNDRGWFSVVIGNRVPQINKHHRAFLVSLEGFQDRLNENWQAESGQLVRLAVLGTWRFTCAGSNDFKETMNLLNFDRKNLPPRSELEKIPDPWLRIPFNKDYDDRTLDPADVVNGAYSRGYTACNHMFRQGEQTVSWYRGPLVPLNYDKPQQLQEPVNNADELLRYDPDTGMFDATYSAAWQLGRLLALQNQSFALALSRVRRSLREQAERKMHAAWLAENFSDLDLSAGNFIVDSLMANLINGSGEAIRNSIPD